MPPKRKAPDGGTSSDNETGHTPKKSKSQLKEEAHARALAYKAKLEAKKKKSPAPTITTSSTTAAAATRKSPPRTTTSTTAKKRTRKSTGSSGSDTDSITSSASSRKGTTRRRGRSSAATAAIGEFVFDPIPEETTAVGPNGTPVTNAMYATKAVEDTTPFRFGAGHSSEGTSSPPVVSAGATASVKKKKNKRESLERARAYGEQLKKKRSSNSPGGGVSSPSPVVVVEKLIPEEQEPMETEVVVASEPPAAAFQKETKLSPPTCNEKPPSSQPKTAPSAAALQDIFSPTRKHTYHRPSANAKFDPNQPFPTKGYKLPTAAYCGCGPTPSLGKSKLGDVCLDDGTTTATNERNERLTSYSNTVTYRRKESENKHVLGKLPSVDPPYTRLKQTDPPIPAIENNTKQSGIDPDGSVMPYRPSVTAKNNTVPAKKKDDVNASILKAKALVSSVAESNNQRRAALGILPSAKKENVAVQMLRVSKEPEDGIVVGSKEPDELDGSQPLPKEEDGMEKVANIDTENQDGDDAEEVESPTFAKRMAKRILFFLFVVMMAQMCYGVFYLATEHVVFGPSSMVLKNGTKPVNLSNQSKGPEEVTQPNCFIDHPADFFTPSETMDEELCAGKFVPCPQWGRCHAGTLLDCQDAGNEFNGTLRFTPNTKGDACAPTEEVLGILESVKNVLAAMTVSQHCNMWDKLNRNNVVPAADEQSYPMFRVEKVAEKMRSMSNGAVPDSLPLDFILDLLLWLEPVDSSVLQYGSFPGTEEDVIDAVGLASAVSPNDLPFTTMCYVRTLSWDLVVLSFRIFQYLAKFIWYYICNHPLMSLVVMVLSYIVSLFLKRKRRLAQINELYPQVLESAYDRLAELDNSEGYPALMLRDDIGREMYPTNLGKRVFLYNEVWPRLVAEIHSDNRVRKFRKEANGKDLEHWDLHKQPKQTRRLRKSLGNTPKRDVDVVDVKPKEVPAGRDP